MRKMVVFFLSFMLLSGWLVLLRIPPGTLGDHSGETDEWDMDMDITSVSEATFISNGFSQFGNQIELAGDIDGDGYDDILLGDMLNVNENRAGKTYLAYGKAGGWQHNLSLEDTDSSFIGENPNDYSSRYISGRGDVNGDGFDDILISAYYNSEGGPQAGQVYLLLGGNERWGKNISLNESDASFIGESQYLLGKAIDGSGDINGDGYDDIIISTYNDHGIYIFFGKTTGWAMDTPIGDADASLISERIGSYAGDNVVIPGDVNGDNYDDILISATSDDEYYADAGQTYLIFGRPTSEWHTGMNLSDSDASFIGENQFDYSGTSVGAGGDVNGDGYDDFLIGAPRHDEEGLYRGKVYLILGKENGWSQDTPLSEADSSFIGEGTVDMAGSGYWNFQARVLSISEDLTGDGLDDIIVGVRLNDDANSSAGQTYMIEGRTSGWPANRSLNASSASFRGSVINDLVGNGVSANSDFNGDGSSDLLVGGYNIAYLIPGLSFTEPTEVYSVETYTEGYEIGQTSFDIGDTVFIEMKGMDGDPTRMDRAKVNISFSDTDFGITGIGLKETGFNTGVYRGEFVIPLRVNYFDTVTFEPRTDISFSTSIIIDYPFRPDPIQSMDIYSDQAHTRSSDMLDKGDIAYVTVIGTDSNPLKVDKAFVDITSKLNGTFEEFLILMETEADSGVFEGDFQISYQMEYKDEITVISLGDGSIQKVIIVDTPILIYPLEDVVSVLEDEEYRVDYWNFGYEAGAWIVSSSAQWLTWDEEEHVLSGIPNNNHIGPWDVLIELSDGKGHRDDHEFQIKVQNTEPHILTEDVTTIHEEEEYYVDYDSDDEGQGTIIWKLIGGNEFLKINKNTGEVSGVPLKSDVGVYNITVLIDDGNGGKNSSSFQLTVLPLEHRPSIITTDITKGKEGEQYYRDYEATDAEGSEGLRWSLLTEASFLTMDPEMGILKGTPGPNDVGTFVVNVTVKDPSGLTDSHEFDLEIEDVNTRPKFVDTPKDSEVLHGTSFTFKVKAEDPDPGSVLIYSIGSDPVSDIDIDTDDGDIHWTASIIWFDTKPYDLVVTIKVTDGELSSQYAFTITVIATQPPVSTILGPEDEIKVPSREIPLEWSGNDPEGETLTYDIYIHPTEAFVIGLRSEALYVSDLSGTSMIVSDLDPGKRYYWTVVPFDTGNYGTNTNGVRSFIVNNPPKLNEIDPQEAVTGSEFTLKVKASDDDGEDVPLLIFSLMDPPDGMTINEQTGFIRWKPDPDQTGSHLITVTVSDGTEKSVKAFSIDVAKGSDDSGFNLLFIILPAVLLTLMVIVFVIIIIIRRRDKCEVLEDEEEVKVCLEEKLDEESRNVIREMEDHKKGIEIEKEYSEMIRYGQSSVASSAYEAHLSDKEHKTLTGEELYGVSEPEMEEGDISKEELRDSFREAAEELEEIETPSEEMGFLDDLISHMPRETTEE